MMESWAHMAAVSVCAVVFGVAAKYADLINDNGLVPPFVGGSAFAGLLWGGAGCALIVLSPAAGVLYVAHVLYWFLRGKLDAANHASAGVAMVLVSMCMPDDATFRRREWLVGLFAAFALSGYAHSFCKALWPRARPFLRLRLRIYLIALAASIGLQDVDPLWATVLGMACCELVTYRHRALRDTAEEGRLQGRRLPRDRLVPAAPRPSPARAAS